MRRLMEYKIISGPVVEIRRSWLPVRGTQEAKPRGTRRAGASTEKKIRANEKSSQRELARLINCNFGTGDAFLTLKYDPDHYPASFTVEAAQEDLKKCLRKARAAYLKRTGKKLKAIWVTANWSPHRQAPARIHHHLVVPGDAMQLLRELWQGGGMSAEFLDNRGDHSDLAAYLQANVHDRPGKKHWSSSRGMEQPQYTEPEEVTEIEDVQPEEGSVIKEHETNCDEEGRVTSAYLRCLLPEPPKVRGGQIVLPRRRRRKRG